MSDYLRLGQTEDSLDWKLTLSKNIGFDDSFIYDELELKPKDRKLPSEILLPNEAITAFEAWAAKEDKIEY